MDYVEAASAGGDKALIFTQYRGAMDDICRALAGYQPLAYHGSLSGSERQRTIDAFQSGARHRVLVLQIRAGGVGLNLQAANRVVHFDSWWNPAVQTQATARAHRLGQNKTVFETTLVSTGTIEERIQEMLVRKRQLFQSVVDDLSVEGVARQMTQDELYGLFGLGAAGGGGRW